MRENGEEKLLPGFENFTHEQLFFMSFANVSIAQSIPRVNLHIVLFGTDISYMSGAEELIFLCYRITSSIEILREHGANSYMLN